MPRRKVERLVMGPGPNEATCERCGKHETIDLPMSVDAFVKWAAYAEARHKDCQPAAEGAGGETA